MNIGKIENLICGPFRKEGFTEVNRARPECFLDGPDWKSIMTGNN